MCNTRTGEALESDPLADIPILKDRFQWDSWIEEVTNFLKMYGYGDLLHRNKDKPELNAFESAEDFRTRLEGWEDRQERACALVGRRLGIGASRLIEKDPENISNRLDKLRSRYEPLKSEVFSELNRRYDSLTLAQCLNVFHYAETLRMLRDKIEKIDETISICEPLFLHRFLSGLGAEYDVFLTCFYMNHRLYPERDSTDPDIIIKPAVTFDKLVDMVQVQEQLNLRFKDQGGSLHHRGYKRRRF